MPIRDGIDLIREIKEKWPETSVIVMTGYSTPETIRKSRGAKADKFIAKPFTPDELLEILHRSFQRRVQMKRSGRWSLMMNKSFWTA